MISLKNDEGHVFIEIERWNAEKVIYANWIGLITEDNVKDGALEILSELRHTGFKRLLNNNRNVLGTWSVANEWIVTEWIPRALELKFEKFAHVLSVYLFGQLSAEELKHHAINNFEMRLFQDFEKARKWLIQ